MKEKIRHLLNQDHQIVLVFYMIMAILLYYKSFGAGLVFDMVDWCINYELYGFKSLFHPTYDYAVRPVYHFILYSFWKLFGTDVFYWNLICLVLHVFNAYLLYIFLKIFFQKFIYKKDANKIVAFISSFLFLIAPLNTEAIVWLACMHYLITSFCLLSILILFELYFQKNNRLLFISTFILYAIAAYSIELAYSIPLVLSAYYILFCKDNKSFKSFFKIIIFPISIITLSVFIFTKVYYGVWIGHYKLNTSNFDYLSILSRFLIQFIEYSHITSFLKYNQKELIYTFCYNHLVVLFIIFIIISIGLYTLYTIKSKNNKYTSFIFLFSSTLFLFIPISIQFFWYMTPIIGDRFHYMVGVFLIPLVVYFFYIFFNKYLSISILIVYLISSIFLLEKNIYNWNASKNIHEKVVNSFRWQNAKRIFVISQANMFNGAYIFGTEDDLKRTMYLTHKIKNIDFYPISFYNMNLVTDKISIEKINDTTLKCSLNQYGNWFWKNMSVGAVDNNNELFDMQTDKNWGLFIQVSFNDIKEGDVFLYQDGIELKEFKFK